MRLLDVLGKGRRPSGRKPPAGHVLGGLQHTLATPAGHLLEATPLPPAPPRPDMRWRSPAHAGHRRRACVGGHQHTRLPPAGHAGGHQHAGWITLLLGRAPLVSRVSSCSQRLPARPTAGQRGRLLRAHSPHPGLTPAAQAPRLPRSGSRPACGPRCECEQACARVSCHRKPCLQSPVPAAGLTCCGRHFSGCLLTSQTQQPVHFPGDQGADDRRSPRGLGPPQAWLRPSWVQREPGSRTREAVSSLLTTGTEAGPGAGSASVPSCREARLTCW